MKYEPDLDTLLAEREIQRQIIRFARAMDDRDWDTIATIADQAMRADFGIGEIRGRSEVIDLIRGFLENCGTTQHLIGNILVDVDGEHATSTCYVADMHLGSNPEDDTSFRTLGSYADTWEKVNGDWRMTSRIKDNRATIGSMDVFKT